MKPYFEDAAAGITIYHGDCREVLPGIGPVDLTLTDPPYELTATGGGIVRSRQYLADITGFTDAGFDIGLLEQFPNWICFASKAQLSRLLGAVGSRRWMLVTWNKPNPTPLVNANYLPDTEYIVHAWQPGRLFGEYRDRARYLVYPGGNGQNCHPNEKPIPVIGKMVRLGSEPGNLILDPFMGSGTTLRAAKDLGRKAIGIEIEERYCEIAAQRLSQEVMDLR